MPSTRPQAITQPAPDAPTWQRIREHLEHLRARINDEIGSYPAPIPACDAQFNYLLEERGRIGEEISRLEAARLESAGQRPEEAAAAFIRSSAYIDEEAARKIGAASS